jgi:hypothetical protein
MRILRRMYKVRGADQRTYGPVSNEVLLRWVSRGHVSAQTLIQQDGNSDWQPLSRFAEFVAAVPQAPGVPTADTQPVQTLPTPNQEEKGNPQTNLKHCEWCGRDNQCDANHCGGCGSPDFGAPPFNSDVGRDQPLGEDWPRRSKLPIARLPCDPTRKPTRPENLPQSSRRVFRNRPLSVGCKALGIVAYIVVVTIFGLLEINRRERKARALVAEQTAGDRSDYHLAQIDALKAEVFSLGFLPPPVRFYLGLFMYVPATALIYLGYRLGLRSADDVLGRKSGSPSIYLRSFGDDGHYDFNPDGPLSEWLGLRSFNLLRSLGPFANVHPLRLLRLCFSRGTDTAEEQLSQFFRKRGPFIAIGRPGEFLAPGGASRVYLTNSQWQDRVRGWLMKADTIVLQPADTPGVWWEIQEVLRTVPHEKVLFCLVNYLGDELGYEQFAQRFQQIAGTRLPLSLGTNCFLWLENGEARLSAPILRWPFTWPFFGCAVDFPKTLKPFFTHNQQPSNTTDPSKKGTLAWYLNAIIAVVMWFAIALLSPALFGGVVHGAWKWHQLHELPKNAAAEALITELIDHSSNGYRWQLPRAWTQTETVGMFGLQGAALVYVFSIPLPFLEPSPDLVKTISEANIRQYGKRLGGAPRMLEQNVVARKGYQWLETVFEIDPTGGSPTLRVVLRVSADTNQIIVATACTRAWMAKELGATLNRALNNIEPVQRDEARPARGPIGYVLNLDHRWQQIDAPVLGCQLYLHTELDANLTISVAAETALNAEFAADVMKLVPRLIPGYQEAGYQKLVSEPFRYREKTGWRLALKFHENGEELLHTMVFFNENRKLFQFQLITKPDERSAMKLLQEVLENFRSTEPMPGR